MQQMPSHYTPENNLTRMTGLLTRHDFHHMGTDIIRSHPERHFAILVMDISNFKFLNVFLPPCNWCRYK